MAPRLAIMLGPCIALWLGSCADRIPAVASQDEGVTHEGSLAEQAERYRGARCTIPESIALNQNSRIDEASCGPFPCTTSGCAVNECSGPHDCTTGFCRDGYCLVGELRGDQVCRPFQAPPDVDTKGAGVDPVLARTQGCACRPETADRRRDYEICGPFPCGSGGCDVRRCDSDDDCAYGLCSSHASWPHGYCVTDDPH